MEKSAKKTVGRPFKKGGDPRQGRGPEPGAPNAGRPPSRVKQLAAEIIERKDLIGKLGSIAESGEDKDKIAAIKVLLAYGDGLPIARQELTGADGGPIETQAHADSPLERIRRKLSGIAARQATAGDASRIQRGAA